MNKVFMFDVDGTLTPSRQPMTRAFDDFFFRWANRNTFYLVSGSDLEKMKEQVPEYILTLARGLFCCGGNQFYIDDELQYENKFKPPQTLLTYLGEQLRFSDYHHRAGNHIEDRGSMVNFSVVGRNCSLMERENYFKWDKQHGERQRIAYHIRRQWKDLDAVIGGQISIDIYPKGKDKSQVLEHIEKRHPEGEIIFIGDRIEEGGNDYPLAQLMDNITDCSWFQTDGWEHTMQILENLR